MENGQKTYSYYFFKKNVTFNTGIDILESYLIVSSSTIYLIIKRINRRKLPPNEKLSNRIFMETNENLPERAHHQGSKPSPATPARRDPRSDPSNWGSEFRWPWRSPWCAPDWWRSPSLSPGSSTDTTAGDRARAGHAPAAPSASWSSACRNPPAETRRRRRRPATAGSPPPSAAHGGGDRAPATASWARVKLGFLGFEFFPLPFFSC